MPHQQRAIASMIESLVIESGMESELRDTCWQREYRTQCKEGRSEEAKERAMQQGRRIGLGGARHGREEGAREYIQRCRHKGRHTSTDRFTCHCLFTLDAALVCRLLFGPNDATTCSAANLPIGQFAHIPRAETCYQSCLHRKHLQRTSRGARTRGMHCKCPWHNSTSCLCLRSYPARDYRRWRAFRDALRHVDIRVAV